MSERKLPLGYLIGSALVLALVVAALVRSRAEAPPTEGLHVWEHQGKPGRWQTAFEAMGTDVRLEAYAPDEDAARRMFAAAARQIDLVNRLMSTYREDSDVSRLNRQGVAEVDERTVAVLRKAEEVSRLSGGAFDVTYAPLRTMWRRAAAEDRLPTPEEVQTAVALVGHEKLKLSGRTVRFERAGMEADLGGIAKGYAIDLAAEALRAEGARAGIVDIGGDLRLFGRPAQRQKWRIEVRRPPGVEEVIVIEVGPCAVATSGDYARGFRVEGRWFSHIIDPRTGRPVDDVPSVTVVAPDAMTADALATALSVMAWGRGLELVDALPGVECMMMLRRADGTIEKHMSAGFAELIGETEDAVGG